MLAGPGSLRRAAAAALLAVAAAFAHPSAAQAQAFGLPFGSPAPVAVSGLASAPIVLDGQTLFSVTAAANAKDQLPVAERARDIADVLAEILAPRGADAKPAYDPRSLRVTVERHGDQNILTVIDDRHRTPLPVVTVTNADALAQQTNPDALATQWQEVLQGALVHALLIRQPGERQRNLALATGLAVALAVMSIVAYGLILMLRRRIEALVAELDDQRRELADAQAQPAAPETSADAAHNERIASLSLRALGPARRLALFRSLSGLLFWGMLLAWFGAGTWAALLFPQTTPLGRTFLKNGFSIALIWIGTAVIDRVSAIAIGRLPLLWDMRHFASPEERTRQTLRVPTIVRALSGFKTFVLLFIAVLATMTQIGIPVGSVVTIGGVTAIAVSLATQNLIRDFVSGFLVLAEDQFVVADFVTINGFSGLVERLTLRMVQIRDGSGSLVTISHSSATSVVNHSRNWSRVDYAVSIEPTADVAHAIEIIRSTIAQIEADAEWKDTIVDPVEWIGVDALSRDGIVIRARIKTAPLRQFALQRELNFRIGRAFGEAKIGLGAPVAPAP